MTKSDEWKLLSDDKEKGSDITESSDKDTQISERKRRLLHSSKTKTHRRHIQDIVSFLQNEAKAADEEVKFEHKNVGSDHIVRVTLGGDSVEARKKTLKTAKEASAKEMLIMIGPYIEDDVWKQHSDKLSQCVPDQYKSTWLPPVFDARHVSVGGDTWYEVDVQLGPVSVVSVSDNLNTSLQSLITHCCHFLSTRPIDSVLKEPLEESLKEMEVYSHLNQPYVQCRNIVDVRMEAADKTPIIPAVDVFTMQYHLPDGKFPPQYGDRDMFGCIKIFRCKLCSEEFTSIAALQAHCHSINHWRRLGKYFINGQLRETFNPKAEPSFTMEGIWNETPEERQIRINCTPKLCVSCLESGVRFMATYTCSFEYFCEDCLQEHLKSRPGQKSERLPFPNVIHPIRDKQTGGDIDKTNLKYLISVLRCVDLPPNQEAVPNGGAQRNKPPSLLDIDVEEPKDPQPFKPPDVQNRPGFGGMYEEGKGFKAGWEDPYAPKMGWSDGGSHHHPPHPHQQQQFGFGRGGGGGYGPQMGFRPPGGFNNGGFGPSSMGFGGQMGNNRMRFNSPGFGGGQRMRPPTPSNIPGPSNPESLGMKKKITAEKKLEKYSGGEIVMPEDEDDSGNAAYTGKIGKTGFSAKNKKETAKYAALPPPGHSQWNQISGNENFKIDNSMANLKPVGANFKANKSGVRVCIPWKRGMCKLGDRCNYTHGDPQQMKLQNLVDANISPLEKDLSGYRIAADVAKSQVTGTTTTGPTGGSNNVKQNGKKDLRKFNFTLKFLFYQNLLEMIGSVIVEEARRSRCEPLTRRPS